MTDLVGFPPARRQARASLLGTWLDGGTLGIYSGTRPATNGGVITDQVLLCEVLLENPAGEAVDGVWVCEPLPDPGINVATGVATWARAVDTLDAVVCDLDAGSPGSGAAVILDNVSLISGAATAILAFTITET